MKKSPAKKSALWVRLTEAMREAGHKPTQVNAGKLVGVQQSSVHKWTTGENPPTMDNAIQLATQLRVCVEWLLTGRGPKRPGGKDDPYLADLMTFWNKLPDATKANVVGYAKIARSIAPAEPLHIPKN